MLEAKISNVEPGRDSSSGELVHDTLRGVGKSETHDFSQTLPFMATPKRMEVATGTPVDIDVYTSVPSGTLPVGTRLPKALLDAAEPARFRGFATMPPVTPKVLVSKGGTFGVGETAEETATADTSKRRESPAPFDAPRFDQTLAFGSIPKPSPARASAPTHDELGTTPSPVTPRAKRPVLDAHSDASTDVPRAPWSTLVSDRIDTQPVPIHHASEETYRPSAHTTPPGLPEAPRRRSRYVWAVAAVPLALCAALATITLEGTSIAQGAVLLEGGTTPIINAVSGPIVQVLVKAGDTVTAGQSVAEIDPSTIDQRREELQVREAALLAERERVTTLGAKWHSAATDALQRKRGLLWQRLKLRSDDNASATVKDKSNTERDAVLLIRQELADVEFELNRRESDRDDQQRTWEHRMNEVRTALSQVNDTSTSVRAPVAGRVEAMLATPGQVLMAGSPVAQLVPESAEAQLVVLVPTRLASALDVGTELPVTLALSETTTLPARVTHIADGNVTREEAASLLNAPQSEPLVRVDIELVAPDSVPGFASALRPGQRISALVPSEKRTLWRHLMSKFE